MKAQIQKPKAVFHTIQSKTKAAKQAPLNKILQKYQAVAQRESFEDEDELLQGKFETAQREELDDEEIPLQAKSENKTGLPDNLKVGVENMSGYSMDDVRVHYNSSKPAQLQALAYTQGTDIHVAPGQEKYLPHEAWHVVQQKQGRVQPTMQLQGVNVNDNEGLEREADMKSKDMLNKPITSSPLKENILQKKENIQMGGKRVRKGLQHAKANVISDLFILQHIGDKDAAIRMAQIRSGDRIDFSHTIDISQLSDLANEIKTKNNQNYHVPANRVQAPSGLLQFLTNRPYMIWESKYKKKGNFSTKRVDKQFYYDAPHNQLHHFDGIHF